VCERVLIVLTRVAQQQQQQWLDFCACKNKTAALVLLLRMGCLLDPIFFTTSWNQTRNMPTVTVMAWTMKNMATFG
jgi:hypothetical protein